MRRYIQPHVIIGSHKTFQKLRECDAVIEAAIQMASTNEGLCRVSSTFGHLCGGRGGTTWLSLLPSTKQRFERGDPLFQVLNTCQEARLQAKNGSILTVNATIGWFAV